MRYYVYLLVSINKEKVTSYVGYTSDLKKRLEQHNNSKGAKFTKGKLWFLAYKKLYNSKSLAMKNEYLLKKNRKLRDKIKINYLKKFK
tara:strand:- start:296 stop:559 length:264 start_codon:yes stop_codon:yes gene_type:complete